MEKNNTIRILWAPNRFSPEGRQEWFVEFVNGQSLQCYIEIMSIVFCASDVDLVYLSSQSGRVDPKTYYPIAGEEIIVSPEIKDPVSIAFSIGWALTAALTASLPISTMIAVAYVVGGLVVAGALVAAGFAIYSAFQKPKTPSFRTVGGTSGSIEEASQTYAWDGVRTIQEVGVPVAIIYGTHRVGGNIINQYVWSDGDKEYLNLLIALGEGEIDSIGDIQINDNPYANYSGLTKYERLGLNVQDVVPGFEELHNVFELGAVLLKDAPFTQRTQDNEVEAIEVEVGFIYGLYGITDAGDVADNSASFRIEYKKHSDTEYIDYGITTITAKSRTIVKRKIKITGLDPDQYDIRLTKTSDDSTTRLTSDMRWTRLDEIKNNDLMYPNTALLALKLLATNQLSGSTPSVTSIVRGLKIKTYQVTNAANEEIGQGEVTDAAAGCAIVFADNFLEVPTVGLTIKTGEGNGTVYLVEPTATGFTVKLQKDGADVVGTFEYQAQGLAEVGYDDYYYDPAVEAFRLFSDDTVLTWDGVTYSTAYCANPAWCFYDLVLNNRYGIGDFVAVSNVDLANIVEMAKFCDQRVVKGDETFEKRFELNVVLDSSHSVVDVLTQLCATFRGWIFYSQGALRLRIDKPELPVQLFGMGNIIKDSFQQSWKSQKEVPNVIDVQFLNAANDYEQEIVASTNEASLETNPMRKKSVRVFTTSITRALREGRYAINLARYVHRSISFKASIDAVACQAGDIISVSHELPSWGVSGRVLAATNVNIEVDKPVTILADVSYKVQIRRAVDDVIEERTVINPAGTYTVVTISASWSVDPTKDDVWCLGELNLLKKDFRIINIKRESSSEVSIAAIEYTPLVYDDSAPDIPTNNLTLPDSDIPNVEDIALSERVVKLQDGTIQNVIDVYWNKPDTSGFPFKIFKSARIYLSSNAGGSYAFQAESSGGHVVVATGVEVGLTYRVAIATMTFSGKEKSLALSPYADIVVTGNNAPPPDVTTFLAYQRVDTIIFGWTEVTALDIDFYEIRRGASWESGVLVASGLKGSYYVTNLVPVEAGQSYWIKAVDTCGNYSVVPQEAVLTVDSVPFKNIIMEWSEEEELALAFDDFASGDQFDNVGDLRFSDTAWVGNKEGLVVSGAALAFDTGLISGKYTTRIKDVGYVAPFRISLSPVFSLAGDQTWQSFGDDTFQTDPLRRFSGQEVACGMTTRIRISEDNITWTDWLPWQDADFYCRYFQLEYTFTRSSVDIVAQCASLHEVADLPDVDEGGAGEVLIAADGAEIVFSKTYHIAPAVAISILSGDGMTYRFSVNPSITGCTVKLYKLDGTPVTGTFSYLIHGL